MSDALWEGVSEREGKWHYMNLFAGNSIWESSLDGSAIWMCYADGADGKPGNGSLIELKINAGAAVEYAAPILRKFGLAFPAKQLVPASHPFSEWMSSSWLRQLPAAFMSNVRLHNSISPSQGTRLMTLLEAIQRDIEEAPTIMSLSHEQEFCRRLMEIPKADLIEQGERVGIILDRLHESHTSVVFEVTSENDFRFFGDWARAFAGQFPDFPQSATMVALADNLESPFSM